MTISQIDYDPDFVNTLAIELERAEYDGDDPDLIPPNMGVRDGHVHWRVTAYWDAKLKADDRGPPKLSTNLEQQREEAARHLERVRRELDHRLARRGEGHSGASCMRRLIDIEIVQKLAARDLKAIDAAMQDV
jgi:hypothetical protein